MRDAEGPEIRAGIAKRRSIDAVSRQKGFLEDFIGRADARCRPVKNWPERKEPVVPADRFHFVPNVRSLRDLFVLVADDRPELPPVQPVAAPNMKDGEGEVPCDDVPFT